MNDLSKFISWKKHLLPFLFALTAMILFYLALVAYNGAKSQLVAAKNLLVQQQGNNATAEQAAGVLEKYLPLYRLLQEDGVITQPQRLLWLEALIADINVHILPSMNFTLEPSEVATDTNTVYKHDTILVKVTPMRLEFTLLHEGDFYQLLNQLHTDAKGVFSAQQCEILRNDTDDDAKKTLITADFAGRCELLWYSLADITQSWEAVDAPTIQE
jgi:hypothetical protein